MKSREESALDVLRNFFAAMRQWELACRRRDREARNGTISYDNAKNINIHELQTLFSHYCVTSGLPARAKFGGVHYSSPPEYDIETEEILRIVEETEKTIIYTQQTATGYNNKCVYTLIRTGKGWRIVDDRKCLDSNGQEAPWDL